MKYISTRGNAPAKTFTEILLGGLAPDGGLYLPEQYPQVSRTDLDTWRKLSYADLAFAVLSKFATDIPAADLKAIINKTYTPAVYSNAAPIPISPRSLRCVRWNRACISSSYLTGRRWRSRTWRCSCSAICLSTRWQNNMTN